MALFKAKALPIVLKDISASIHRGSRNSTKAIALLHDFVRIDPPDFNLEDLVLSLAIEVFWLTEERYPEEAVRLLERAGATADGAGEDGPAYWSIYAYLFSLLPALVERPRVGGARWSAEEYRQLERTCFSHWCDNHPDDKDSVIMGGYKRVQSATKAWFNRKSRRGAALESCASATVDDIGLSFPKQDGTVREMGFRFAVEELVDSLYPAFRADLASNYQGGKVLGFFASDPAPLPSHIEAK